MANINKIRLSGQTYDIQDPNASKTVELTQAQYDALTVKDPNTFYIITDAQGADLSNYYTKSETSGATEISTALNAKQDTLVSGTNIKTINNESILGSGNIEIEGGGGKAVVAGRGIRVTTGETADTVSFNLPIYNGSGNNSIYLNSKNSQSFPNNASGENSFVVGTNNIASGSHSIAMGGYDYYGDGCSATTYNSFAMGRGTLSEGFCSIAKGYKNKATNQYEESGGRFNVSNKANTTWGDSGNTLFSVGNGTENNARHNAFEIRQNGDIYISSGGTDIKLQDHLGGGGGASYSAGTGIDITNDVISVTGKVDTSTYETYTAATATAIGNKLATSDFNTYSGTVDTAINSKASQSDLSTLSGTVTAHTANTDIHVTTAQTAAWNAKSDFSGSYNDLTDKPTIPTVPTSNTAFTNDAGYITSDAISGKADTSAVTESINAAVSGKVDTSTFNTYSGSVETALSGKQDTLSAGTNITIVDNVISAEGGGGKAVSGGTNISITTGETADTINCTIPFEDSSKNLLLGYNFNVGGGTFYSLGISPKDSSTSIQTKISGNNAIAIGNNVTITGDTSNRGEYSVAIGKNTNVNGVQSTALGIGCNANGNTTLAIGRYSTSKGNDSVAIGNQANVNGNSSVAIGRLAKVSGDSSVAIGSGATANGVDYKTNINNQLKIDTSNQIYVKDKTNTNEVCLQDTIAATAANTTALGGLSLVKLTQAQYDALATKDSNVLYVIVG